MDQLLFLLPHPGGCGRIASTGLLFRCVPDERQRSAGRHLLKASPLRQVSGSEKRRMSIRQPPNPRPHHAAGRRHAYPEEAPPARPPPSPVPRRAILPFLFWTVHGPFSLFLLEGKEKMGGAMNQPSSWLNPPRPQGRVQPSPSGEERTPHVSYCGAHRRRH